tara:strand:- start:369 stop:632 length:264 start_codon:yes stop_codon:yes gene_type:complete
MPTIGVEEHTQTAKNAPTNRHAEERLHMSEIRHGDTVTSKFFKGTGVVVGSTEVVCSRTSTTQTLWEVRAPEEEFRLRIREQELEKA